LKQSFEGAGGDKDGSVGWALVVDHKAPIARKSSQKVVAALGGRRHLFTMIGNQWSKKAAQSFKQREDTVYIPSFEKN